MTPASGDAPARDLEPPPAAARAEDPSADPSDVVVGPARPEDDGARDRWLEGHPDATVFHLAAWRRAVERQFGHEPCDLLARRGDELVGVLPLARTRGPLGRRHLVSVPYAVYGGPVAADEAVERALVDAAVRQAEAERVGRLELRCLRPGALDLVRSELYATFVEDLPQDPAQVLAGMPKKARAEARKARERHGLELHAGPWYLEDLHRLFHANKRQLGSPGLPLEWFRELLAQLGEDVVEVHVVRREREPVAAVMSFLWRGTVYAYYAGTAEHADREWSASNFMYMALREWAVRAGHRRFDFGRSRRDSGAFRFKKNQGFEPTLLEYRYHLVRDRHLPSFTPSNPRTRLLRTTWSKLPTWATRRLSGGLARWLP